MVRRRIKDYIDKHGISQRELADGVGMTPGSISMMLHGKLNLKVDRYLDICAYLGVDPGEFMAGAEKGRKIYKAKPTSRRLPGAGKQTQPRKEKGAEGQEQPRGEKGAGQTQPQEEKGRRAKGENPREDQEQPGKEKSKKGTAKGDKAMRAEELGAGLEIEEVKEKEGLR